MRCRFFEDRISAGDFWGCRPGCARAVQFRSSLVTCPGAGRRAPRAPLVTDRRRPRRGDRFAGATAVAWAAAPGGASVRERFAAGG